MNKHLLLALTLSLAVATGRAQTAGGPGQTPADPLKLGFFTSTPKAIDGCEADYTYDSVALKSKRYLVITNLQELAFIRVNGKTITLKRKSQTSISEETSKEVFTGSGYTVTVISTDGRPTGDEGGLVSGTVEVRFGQTVIKIKVHGQAGC